MTDPPPAPGAVDDGTAAAQREEQLLAAAAEELDAVQAALGRLDDGTIDRCEVCGRPVGIDRLRADPLLTRCADHTAGTPAGPVGSQPGD